MKKFRDYIKEEYKIVIPIPENDHLLSSNTLKLLTSYSRYMASSPAKLSVFAALKIMGPSQLKQIISQPRFEVLMKQMARLELKKREAP